MSLHTARSVLVRQKLRRKGSWQDTQNVKMDHRETDSDTVI